MTASTTNARAVMIDTIARFLEEAGPARGWTTPRDGAERLAAMLLPVQPMACLPVAAPGSAVGALAVTRSLRQLRQQEARLSGTDAPLPSWACCADDHCRTVQHCPHESVAVPPAATAHAADQVPAPRAAVVAASDRVEPVSAD